MKFVYHDDGIKPVQEKRCDDGAYLFGMRNSCWTHIERWFEKRVDAPQTLVLLRVCACERVRNVGSIRFTPCTS